MASDTVLTLEISGALSDGPPQTGLAGLLAGPQRNLSDVLGALERARSDPRVKGLMLRIGGGELGLAQVQELRDAIRDFRAKGKPVFAYSDSYGEFESGTAAYYLASSCDEVWLQPLGLLSLVGLRAEQPFFRGSLDKLGIVPRFDKREEYKTAMNMLTDTAMTPAQREETTSLLTSLRGQIVSGIAQGRKLDPALVGDLIDKGPYLAQEALDNHLVDHLGYGEDALAGLKQAAGGDVKTMTLAHYLDRVGPPHAKGPVIALIYADGLMVRGKSDDTGLLGNGLMGSESVIHAFRLAERDKDVRAILFRIDSPGGSAVAAESVWNEVKAARAAGKKVIVSMGGVAGSGGYYIASDADKIVAEPATLTGSIGVLAGKVLVNGLSDKLGVTWDDVDTGGNAAMFSPIEDFSPAGHARFEAMLDDIYAGFKSRVAEGRKMDADCGRERGQGPGLDRRAGDADQAGRRARRLRGGARLGQGPGRHRGRSGFRSAHLSRAGRPSGSAAQPAFRRRRRRHAGPGPRVFRHAAAPGRIARGAAGRAGDAAVGRSARLFARTARPVRAAPTRQSCRSAGPGPGGSRHPPGSGRRARKWPGCRKPRPMPATLDAASSRLCSIAPARGGSNTTASKPASSCGVKGRRARSRCSTVTRSASLARDTACFSALTESPSPSTAWTADFLASAKLNVPSPA